jgi:uncharacterized membrane protein YhhN
MIGPAVATVVCVIAVVALVAAERRGDHHGRWRWKPLASAGFVAVPIVGDRGLSGGSSLVAWIVGGLVFGAVGDLALIRKSDRWFTIGLGAFLLGHIGYVIGFATVVPIGAWLRGPTMIAVAVAITTFVLLVVRRLWPTLGPLRVPVLAYVAIITAMVIGGVALSVHGNRGTAAITRAMLTTSAGLFFASDLTVAREKFLVRDRWNPTLGLPIYYAAQLGFGWALIVR